MTDNKDDSIRICDYEGSTYQTVFWEEGDREYEDRVEAVALSKMLPKSGDRLLEVGAGAGRNTPRYQGFRQIVLLDYSITQLQQAQGRLGRGERYLYVAADAYHMPFVSGLFDTVTMIRVIHHMTDGPAVLAEIRRTLSSGGCFVLEYANKLNLKAIGRYLIRRQPWNPFDPRPIEFVELNYNFHPTTTRSWLHQAGFRVLEERAVSHFRVPFLKRWVPLRWLVSADRLFQPTGKYVRLSPSIFVKNQAIGESPQVSAGAMFRCLVCDGEDLTERQTVIQCPACGTSWGIEDGIYNFKTPLSS